MSKKSGPRAAPLNRHKSLFVAIILLAVLLLGGGWAVIRLCETEAPRIELPANLESIGGAKSIELSCGDEKSGLRQITITIGQNGKESELFNQSFPRQGYFSPGGPKRVPVTFSLDPKKLKLTEGKAELLLTARDFSCWGWGHGNVTLLRHPVVIDTTPPRITVVDNTRYVNNGGSGLVVYRLSEPVASHGVLINGHFHPGFPAAPEQGDIFLAYIAFAHDIDTLQQGEVVATDLAGNQGRTGLTFVLHKDKLKQDNINLSEHFLTTKMPEFAARYPKMPAEPEEQFLYANRVIRLENTEKIEALCQRSSSERLWHGTFQRMSRSSNKASFADQRTYFFKGKEIDRQVHLGIDLASTSRAEVVASNRGQVVFADYLGIYGNMVMLDHGQGIFSLYGHMSEIAVAVGQMVEKNGLLGRSGLTGMAGGDHLHFSLLVNGVFVDPREWWDDQWIKLKVANLWPKK